MRISDWSSDVCSSDLPRRWPRIGAARVAGGRVPHHVDPRRDADPAQWCPPGQAPPRLTQSFGARPSAGASPDHLLTPDRPDPAPARPAKSKGKSMTVNIRHWQDLKKPSTLESHTASHGTRKAHFLAAPPNPPNTGMTTAEEKTG